MAVKKIIEDVQGKDNYPWGQQLLIHNGKVLKDESTLEENKVSEDGFLVVMLSKVFEFSFMYVENPWYFCNYLSLNSFPLYFKLLTWKTMLKVHTGIAVISETNIDLVFCLQQMNGIIL